MALELTICLIGKCSHNLLIGGSTLSLSFTYALY